MTTPTHIRAWAAVDPQGRIVPHLTKRSNQQRQQARLWLIEEKGWTMQPCTIVLGHELADRLEKEK